MTKKRFIKYLRSVGVSEKVIRSYIELVAKFGGAQSYQSIYDFIVKQIVESIIREYPPTQINYIKMPLMNLDADYYQQKIYNFYDVKPLESNGFICIGRC